MTHPMATAFRRTSVLLLLVGISAVILVGTASDLLGQSDSTSDQAKVSSDSIQAAQAAVGAVSDQGNGSQERKPALSWMVRYRFNVLIIVGVFFILVLVLTSWARKNRDLPVRAMPAIEAIETAIGQAAESGKPIVYIPGVFDVDNIETIASMVILSDVARKAAEKGVRLIVPLNRAFLIPLAEESVKRGMEKAGRIEGFKTDDIRYLSDDHFAYAAAVDGIMLRERPAAVLYLGGFGAEALILAEMGYSAGAIQVAGTAEIQQLPFLVAACDQTLIGEEFFAASAYISRESKLLGSLRAGDVMKMVIIAVFLVGSILELMGVHILSDWLVVQ